MKVLRIMLIVAAIMALFIGCSSNTEKIVQEGQVAKEAGQKFRTAIETDSLELFLEVLTDDVKLITKDGAEFNGKEQAAEWFKTVHENYKVVIAMYPVKGMIDPHKKEAHGAGQYRFTRTNKETGEVEEEDGDYRTVWRQQDDGSWKLQLFQWMNHQQTAS